MWLTSFDPDDVWAPTEVELLRHVRIGHRTDHAWARLDPPIDLIDPGSDVYLVILGARHKGFDVWNPRSWPVHVYICTVPEALNGQDAFTSDEVQIARWGRLHETQAAALSNEL